ncbi:MAG TPA: SRPBCC domain-containing protein [Nitrososphaerales archaeon]|nr:SRPBCC domain-containing protein [Nitrososphaerales archaeon]
MSEPSTTVPTELRSIGFNRKELRTQIDIDAPVERVWGVLTDFDKFHEWNPFIRTVSGRIEKNQKLNVILHPSGGRTTKMRPSVVKVEPNKELRWVGHLGVPGIFDGQHIFELKPSGDAKTIFVQREQFGGVLLPFLTGMLRNETTRGFNEMNQALKKRAEG